MPILRKWQSVNDAECPYCNCLIRVNMSRHLHASHTENQCHWRCPVTTCPMWFTSKLNGKDHLERIHKFREGRGYSFYECLRKFGLEWFGRRSFFDLRGESGQALWMDLALARRSGQELHNNYVITNSPVMAHLRHFFHAAVRDITAAYEDLAVACVIDDIKPSICDQMRREIAQGADDSEPSMDQASGYDIPVGESVPPPTISSTTPPPVVDTPRKVVDAQQQSFGCFAVRTVRAASVPYAPDQGGCSTSIASTELQSFCGNITHGSTDVPYT